jgi:hypothetical protein
MLTRLVALLIGVSALLGAGSLLLGRALPGGAQIAYGAWVSDRMVTQIADTQRGVRYHLPTRYGSATPIAWLTADHLLLTMRLVGNGPQRSAAIFTPGHGVQAIRMSAACFPDTVTGGGGRLACLERDGSHLYLTSVDCALRACPEPTARLRSDDAIFDFAWSPDGARLALVTIGVDSMALTVVDGATGDRIITPEKVGAIHPQPHWTSDSQSLAYFSRRERQISLNVIDIPTQNRRPPIPITFIDRSQPFALAPNAQNALMVDYNPPSMQLIEVDLQDAVANVLNDSLYVPQYQFLQWSPDGRQIAFYGQRDDLGSGLMLVDTEARSVRMLVQTPLLGDHFIWRPCQGRPC